MEELDIRHFKLVNGDDIIGLVNRKNDNAFLVERPVIAQSNMLGGYQFSHWFPFSDAKTFKIMKNDIVQHVSIAEDVKETYVQFVLKSTETQRVHKTDQQILEEFEDRLINDYADNGVPLGTDKKRTIH
jgi:hypothetical protein|tara:strand:- start:259 stop:645 length:387 start_codon:yes stop_codon:yes gene_type:complete